MVLLENRRGKRRTAGTRPTGMRLAAEFAMTHDAKPEPQPKPPEAVDLADESVAGEEDPGAALDVAVDAPAEPVPQPPPGKGGGVLGR